MLSKVQSKYIRSLKQHKFRQEHQTFLAEGVKIADEWLHSNCKIQHIVAVDEWWVQNEKLGKLHPEAEMHHVKEHELEALSELNTPNQVLLVIQYPEPQELVLGTNWFLALDHVQDPGNMGTIIRIADWFGIHQLICSPGCADIYNPKVVQAAMGSHIRVQVFERNLIDTLPKLGLEIFAATLHGENVYQVTRQQCGIIVIGNESKGISEEVLQLSTRRVTIPPNSASGAESLNVSVATGILCALLLPC